MTDERDLHELAAPLLADPPHPPPPLDELERRVGRRRQRRARAIGLCSVVAVVLVAAGVLALPRDAELRAGDGNCGDADHGPTTAVRAGTGAARRDAGVGADRHRADHRDPQRQHRCRTTRCPCATTSSGGTAPTGSPPRGSTSTARPNGVRAGTARRLRAAAPCVDADPTVAPELHRPLTPGDLAMAVSTTETVRRPRPADSLPDRLVRAPRADRGAPERTHAVGRFAIGPRGLRAPRLDRPLERRCTDRARRDTRGPRRSTSSARSRSATRAPSAYDVRGADGKPRPAYDLLRWDGSSRQSVATVRVSR